MASATTTAAVTPTPGASASASPGGSASASRTPGPTPTPSFYTSVAVYVSNAGYSSILTFPAHGAGNAPPKILSGPLTGLQDPVGIFVDAFKDIFVVNTVAGTVLEFSPGKSGNAKPIATITGTNTGLDLPDNVALDGVGNIYVTNSGQVVDSVTEYAPESNGNVLPIATISGAQTGLAGPTGIVIDRKGVIYVANSSASSITEYAAGSTGDAAPTATITGSDTGLLGPVGITLDSAGNLYVANYTADSITEYAAGSTGNPAPTAMIAGSETGLSNPEALAVNASGNIYVSNYANSTVTEYAVGSTGNVAPIVTLSGVQMLNPQSLAIASIFPTAPLAATPTPTPTPRSIFSISPNSIVFPTVGVGAPPVTQTFTITNPGAKASGNVEAGDLTSTKAYKVTGKGAFTLARGAHKTVKIVFDPPSGLVYSGAIGVTSKSPASLGIVNVTGTGQGGTLAVPNTPLVFGNQPVGQTSNAQSVKIKNSGLGALHVTVDVNTLGEGAGVFVLTSGKGSFTLAGGKTATASVQFTPKTKKKYLEALEVHSDDPNNLEVPILLSGTGT